MSIQLYLYTTMGCHLCELAEALIEQAPLAGQFTLNPVEISTSNSLMEAYGLRIPVLKRGDNGRELGWPFDAGQLHEFLA